MSKPGPIGDRIEVVFALDRNNDMVEEYHPLSPVQRTREPATLAELEQHLANAEATIIGELKICILRAEEAGDLKLANRLRQIDRMFLFIVPVNDETLEILPWEGVEHTLPQYVGSMVRRRLYEKMIAHKTILVPEGLKREPLVEDPTTELKVVPPASIFVPAQRRGPHDSDAEATTMVVIVVRGYRNNDPGKKIVTFDELDQYLTPIRNRYMGYSEEEFVDMFHGHINWALGQVFGEDLQTTSVQQVITPTDVYFVEVPVAAFPSVEGRPRDDVRHDSRFRVVHHRVPRGKPKQT